MSGSRPTGDSPTRANAERTRAGADAGAEGAGVQALARAGAESRRAVAVAVSGGPDSMALLWTTWRCASALGLRTVALHVHHGLQAAADHWPDWIAQECDRWSQAAPQWAPIELRVTRLRGRPARGQSVEEWAREGRYNALVRMAQDAGVDLVLLAHHRRDQAETFMLQALRGAGPAGLAGMPRLQWRDSVCLGRPWLDMPRPAIEALTRAADLRVVQDPSNDDTRFSRNRLRREVWPFLEAAFGPAEAALAQAARRCAQVLEPLEQAAQADWVRCLTAVGDDGRRVRVKLQGWADLSPDRRSWVLRRWLTQVGLVPRASLVDRLAAHDLVAQKSARWPLDARHEIHWYRQQLCIRERPRAGEGARAGAAAVQELSFARSGRRRLEGWGGTLTLRRAREGEWGLEQTLPLLLWARARQGSDRFQLSPRGIPRSLKKQFQTRAVAAWDRAGPVIVRPDGQIVLVPGLGMDARLTRPEGRWVLEWRADESPQA